MIATSSTPATGASWVVLESMTINSGYVILRAMSSAQARYDDLVMQGEQPVSEYWSQFSIDGAAYRGVGRPVLEQLRPDATPYDVSSLLIRFLHGDGPDDEASARQHLGEIALSQGRADDEPLVETAELALQSMRLLKQVNDWDLLRVSLDESREHATLGWDVGYLGGTDNSGEFYSLISDTYVLPLWHGPPEGEDSRTAAEAARKLNNHLLFSSAEDARVFIAWYETTEWGEQGDFYPMRIDEYPAYRS